LLCSWHFEPFEWCYGRPDASCLCFFATLPPCTPALVHLHSPAGPPCCRLLSPRPYFTSQQLDAKRWAATLTIQRYARGWAARQRARTLRRHKEAREGFLEEAAAAAEDAAETKRRWVGVQDRKMSRSKFA
jgi:hypothetical protein